MEEGVMMMNQERGLTTVGIQPRQVHGNDILGLVEGRNFFLFLDTGQLRLGRE